MSVPSEATAVVVKAGTDCIIYDGTLDSRTTQELGISKGCHGISHVEFYDCSSGSGGDCAACDTVEDLLVKYEWEDGEFVAERSHDSIGIGDVTTDEDGEPTAACVTTEYCAVDIVVKAGTAIETVTDVSSGDCISPADLGMSNGGGQTPAISYLAFYCEAHADPAPGQSSDEADSSDEDSEEESEPEDEDSAGESDVKGGQGSDDTSDGDHERGHGNDDSDDPDNPGADDDPDDGNSGHGDDQNAGADPGNGDGGGTSGAGGTSGDGRVRGTESTIDRPRSER